MRFSAVEVEKVNKVHNDLLMKSSSCLLFVKVRFYLHLVRVIQNTLYLLARSCHFHTEKEENA